MLDEGKEKMDLYTHTIDNNHQFFLSTSKRPSLLIEGGLVLLQGQTLECPLKCQLQQIC
ncbi:hypothetical protein POPTR_002G155350v4 [Populus trichocarpa]|uniref:Uncharacterized protein n=1 Tax=Populus trichocarpa TaxID=3694 RepID=A0A3N7FZD4_POPTR|nr:hypothetical protein POPTR_002G155350v4 [Populus trichocarpa]